MKKLGVNKLDYLGEEKEAIRGKDWDWKNFESTERYPVSDNLIECVIGQDMRPRQSSQNEQHHAQHG
ncbi:MAG: hypothetical protein ACOWW1_04605 [archaeon]